MDLNIIKLIFKFGKFLALTPSSIEPATLSCFEKCYIFLTFSIYTVGVIVTLISRKIFYDQLTIIRLFLRLLLDIDLYFFNCYIALAPMLTKKRQWFKLFKYLPKIDASHLIFLVNVVFSFYVWLTKLNWNFFKLYLLEYFQMYSQFFYLVLGCIILQMLLSRYRHQTLLLRQQIQVGRIRLPSEFPRVLRKVQFNILMLKEVADIFCDIFGWVILFIIFFTTLKYLGYLDNVVKGENSHVPTDIGLRISISISQNATLVLFSIGILSFVLLCDEILKEFEAILELSYKVNVSLTEGLTGRESDEIQNFIDVVSHNHPQFTAARFFNIDRTTIFSILNSLTTFLLIIIQFNLNI
ncbi:7tm 7 domain containing protein [Asbolus verrucosus]|uniref:Gustatory receptor n=1 Tax=Asbolus verrucosus TaxID=1661398 RepID=A0A482VBX8_ASBVE|nr:7tm 7 domain containing protein [Asbolus verrucosus]